MACLASPADRRRRLGSDEQQGGACNVPIWRDESIGSNSNSNSKGTRQQRQQPQKEPRNDPHMYLPELRATSLFGELSGRMDEVANMMMQFSRMQQPQHQ